MLESPTKSFELATKKIIKTEKFQLTAKTLRTNRIIRVPNYRRAQKGALLMNLLLEIPEGVTATPDVDPQVYFL